MVELLHNEMAFRAYAREMVNKHRMFKMEYAHYEAFPTVFIPYVEKQVSAAGTSAQFSIVSSCRLVA